MSLKRADDLEKSMKYKTEAPKSHPHKKEFPLIQTSQRQRTARSLWQYCIKKLQGGWIWTSERGCGGGNLEEHKHGRNRGSQTMQTMKRTWLPFQEKKPK